jgi:hypothetical protein
MLISYGSKTKGAWRGVSFLLHRGNTLPDDPVTRCPDPQPKSPSVNAVMLRRALLKVCRRVKRKSPPHYPHNYKKQNEYSDCEPRRTSQQILGAHIYFDASHVLWRQAIASISRPLRWFCEQIIGKKLSRDALTYQEKCIASDPNRA